MKRIRDVPISFRNLLPVGAIVTGAFLRGDEIRLIVEDDPTVIITLHQIFRVFEPGHTWDETDMGSGVNTVSAPPTYIATVIYGNVAQHIYKINAVSPNLYTDGPPSTYDSNTLHLF